MTKRNIVKQIFYCVGDIFLTVTWEGEGTVSPRSTDALDEMPIHPKLPHIPPLLDLNGHKGFFKLSYFCFFKLWR